MSNNFNYSKEYIQSILSYIAYINMDGTPINNINTANLINQNLNQEENIELFYQNYKLYILNKLGEEQGTAEYLNMESTIDFFLANFKIIDQQVEEGWNGFSGITYEVVNDLSDYGYSVGQKIVAFRGTEDQKGDYWTDLILATSNNAGYILDKWGFNTQQGMALKYLENTIAGDYLDNDFKGGNQIYIAGHSLGGFLAVSTMMQLAINLSAKYPDIPNFGESYVRYYILGVSTFNGAGLSWLDGWFNEDPTIKDLVNNFYSIRGTNLVTSNFWEANQNSLILSPFTHLGKRVSVITENAGGGENHSIGLLVKSLGLFSLLEKLISDIPTTLTDTDGNVLTDDAAFTYSIERLLMNSVYQQKDEGLAMDALAKNIIQAFGIPQSELIYSTPFANLINLRTYFESNPSMKINVINPFDGITNTDTNTNRSKLYSLINNMSYVIEVDANYSSGIFNRDDVVLNELYNPENYNETYLEARTLFNKVFLQFLEKKIITDIAGSYSFNLSETTAKFVYIEQLSKLNSSSEQLMIYINTTPEAELYNTDTRYIQFKNINDISLNVNYNNTVLFDTVFQDFIQVFSKNSIIYSMGGEDYIYFSNTSENNTLLMSELSDQVHVTNKSLLLNSLYIDLQALPANSISFKANQFTSDFINNTLTIKYGDTIIDLKGISNIVTAGGVYEYQNIFAIISSFKEMFSNIDDFASLVVDQSFVDAYIQKTLNQFGQVNFENTSEKDYSKITVAHADYVSNQLLIYSGLTSTSTDVSSLIDYVHGKEYISTISFTLLPKINTILTSLNFDIKDGAVKDQLNQQLDKFNANYYSDVTSIDIANHIQKASISYGNFNDITNQYNKKETKVYEQVFDSDNNLQWVWTGQYEYNRSINGEQVQGFYGEITGDLINYYDSNIFFDLRDEANNSMRSVSGSDGSDVIIANKAFGQSNYYGETGSDIVSDSENRLNGNDILIGTQVTAYSGNNLLISYSFSTEDSFVKGGRGNDTIIALNYSTIYANHLSVDTETLLSHNEITLKYGGIVYSSNGKNTITSLQVSDLNNYLSTIFYATGNDTFIVEGNGTFFGGKAAYDLAITEKNYSTIDFYSKYPANSGINYVYSGSGIFQGFLGEYDVADLLKGSGFVYGLGYNELNVGSNFEIFSGGNSSLNIQGSASNIYLGLNDIYNLENSFGNTLYTRGYHNNIDMSLQNETYLIDNFNNTLVLGLSEYIVNLNGTNSIVRFGKNNEKQNIINVHETGTSTIDLSNDLIISNIEINATNNISIKGNSQIESLMINAQGDIEASTINAETVTLLVNGNLSLDNVNINELNINTTKLSNSIHNITQQIGTIGTLNWISDNLMYLTFNGSKINNILLFNAVISGYLTDVTSFNFSGVLNDITIDTKLDGGDISIEGFIEHALFNNISSFNYNRTIQDGNQSNYDIHSVNINDFDFMRDLKQTNINFIGDINGTLIIDSLNNSILRIHSNSINNLIVHSNIVNGSILSIEGTTETPINFNFEGISVEGASSNYGVNDLSYQVDGYNSLQISYASNIIISGMLTTLDKNFNLTLRDISDTVTITNYESSGLFNIRDVEEVNLINSTIGLFLSNGLNYLGNINSLLIDNVTINGDYPSISYVNNIIIRDASIVGNVLTINDSLNVLVDLDTVNGKLWFINVENVVFKASEFKITIDAINDIGIGTNYENNYSLDVLGTIYNKQNIIDLRTSFLNGSEAYAIITSSGIETFNIPVANDIPVIDGNGVYQGTIGNDTYELNENKAYVLHGKQGNDTYNFTHPYNYSVQNINYAEGDGLDTVNLSGYYNLKFNLENMFSSNLSFVSEKDGIGRDSVMNVFYLGIQIFKINNFFNANVSLNMFDKTITNNDIQKILKSIYGTSDNDIITTQNSDINHIYAGLGDDVINITQGYSLNQIYYNFGDGHDIINTLYNNYTVVFENTIDKSLITYQAVDGSILNVLYNNEIIMTINESNYATLQFVSTNESIQASVILSDLTAITGTEGVDVITVDTASTVRAKGGDDIINVNVTGATIYAGTGNDIVNLNYQNVDASSIVNYQKGDGLTTLKLSAEVFNKVTVNLNDITTLKFEYDTQNHNTLNIYTQTVALGAYTKIMVIENYRRVLFGTFTEGRATISTVSGYQNNTYFHNTINTEAENNYQKAMSANAISIQTQSEMDTIISTMSSYDSSDGGQTPTSSVSDYLDKK